MNRVFQTRGRCREAAADYIGVGLTKFDEMVADGRMPQPRQVDSRVIWDIYELDEAFERLPKRGACSLGNPAIDPWTEMAA